MEAWTTGQPCKPKGFPQSRESRSSSFPMMFQVEESAKDMEIKIEFINILCKHYMRSLNKFGLGMEVANSNTRYQEEKKDGRVGNNGKEAWISGIRSVCALGRLPPAGRGNQKPRLPGCQTCPAWQKHLYSFNSNVANCPPTAAYRRGGAGFLGRYPGGHQRPGEKLCSRHHENRPIFYQG